MPFSSFPQFSAALCETAGVATPEPSPDPNGISAFHLVAQGVVVNLVHLHVPDRDNDDAFILVTFGTIPEGMELQVLQLLTEANFSMLSADAPMFGRNPATGEIVLRQRVVLSQVEAADVLGSIVRLAAFAQQWRANPTMVQAPRAEAAVATHLFA